MKTLVILTSFSFLLPSLSWAFESPAYAPGPGARTHHLAEVGRSLEIPAQWGQVKASFQGGPKTIICIQDLHCNHEVQKNISSLIGHLVKQSGVKLIGVEGAFGPLGLEKIRLFPDPALRAMACDYFVKQGKLTGAEYYAATAQKPVRLIGIEDPVLYRASRAALDGFFNAESQGYCYDLRESLQELKPRLYPATLLTFDRRKRAYRQGRLGIHRYAAFLGLTANRMKLAWSDLAELNRFIAQPAGNRHEAGDPDVVFAQLDLLDQRIREPLYTDREQRHLDELERRVDLIERVLNIAATPADVVFFQTHPEAFRVQAFASFFQKHADTKPTQNPAGDWQRLDAYLDRAEAFYRLADERSVKFVDSLLGKMSSADQNVAVLVSGGYHTPRILEDLRRRGLSFVSLQPCLTRQDVVNPYFDLLQNRRTPLERLLEKNQILFALRSSLENKQFWADLELTLKPLLLASPDNRVREKGQAFLDANQTLAVVKLSREQAVAEGVEDWPGFTLLSTSLKDATGQPLAIVVGPANQMPEPGQAGLTLIDHKTLAGQSIHVYASIEQAARAVKQARSWALRRGRLSASLNWALAAKWLAWINLSFVAPAWAQSHLPLSLVSPWLLPALVLALVAEVLTQEIDGPKANWPPAPEQSAKVIKPPSLPQPAQNFLTAKDIDDLVLAGAASADIYKLIMQQPHYFRLLFNWKELTMDVRMAIEQYVTRASWASGKTARYIGGWIKKFVFDYSGDHLYGSLHHELIGKGFRRIGYYTGDPTHAIYEHPDRSVVRLKFSRSNQHGLVTRIEVTIEVKRAFNKVKSIKDIAFKVGKDGKAYPKNFSDVGGYFLQDRQKAIIFAELVLGQLHFRKSIDPTKHAGQGILPAQPVPGSETSGTKISDKNAGGKGVWPFMLALWVNFSGKPDTYAARIAPWLENGLSAALFGLGTSWLAWSLGYQDPALLLGIGNLAAWVGFWGLHYISVAGQVASAEDKAAAGKIAFFNIILGITVAALGGWFSLFALSPLVLPAAIGLLLVISIAQHKQVNRADVLPAQSTTMTEALGEEERGFDSLAALKKTEQPEPAFLERLFRETLPQERTYAELEEKYSGKMLVGMTFVLKKIGGIYHLLFIRRGLDASDHVGVYTLPVGKRSGNETPGQTSLRELREETGLVVSQPAGYLEPFQGNSPQVIVSGVVVVLHEDQEPQVQKKLESDQFVWVPVDDIERQSGEQIEDLLIKQHAGKKLFEGIKVRGLDIFKQAMVAAKQHAVKLRGTQAWQRYREDTDSVLQGKPAQGRETRAASTLPYNEPVSRRSVWLDRAPMLVRRVAIAMLGLGFALLSLGSTGQAENQAKAFAEHPAMQVFKLRHGLTSAAAIRQDHPDLIGLRTVGTLEFLTGFKTFFQLWQGEREVTLTPAILQALNLESLNEVSSGWRGFARQWLTRSGLARQLLILNLEQQTRLYDRMTRWQVWLARWGWSPVDQTLQFEPEETVTPIDATRLTYAQHVAGQTQRNVSPLDLLRLIHELAEDIAAEANPGGVSSHRPDLASLFNQEELLSVRDGLEKVLMTLESQPKGLWSTILSEFRGQPAEALVASGVLEAVLAGSVTRSFVEATRPLARAGETIQRINTLAAPQTLAAMAELLASQPAAQNSNVAARQKFYRQLLQRMKDSARGAALGAVVPLRLADKDAQILAGEIDRLHAQDRVRAVPLGEENGDSVVSVCDARRKPIVVLTPDGKQRVEFLAPSLGEVQGQEQSPRSLETAAERGTLRWSEFQGREQPLAPEPAMTPQAAAVNRFGMLFLRALGSRGRLQLGLRLQKIFPSLALASFDQAVARMVHDLDQDIGFLASGIETADLALIRIELTRPNSHLRGLYRRLAMNPGDLNHQAAFAKALARFLTKYEKIFPDTPHEHGWSHTDVMRMNILVASHLVQHLDTLPSLPDFAQPDANHPTITHPNSGLDTKPLGSLSILSILVPQTLEPGDRKVLGIQGSAGAWVDLLERHYFVIDETMRNKYFRRIFRLRMSGAA